MKGELIFYKNLLDEIKVRIRQGQLRATLSANNELLATYWDIGRIIHRRQQEEGWGKGVIPQRSVAQSENQTFFSQGLAETKEQIVQLPVAQLKNTDNQYYLNMSTGWSQRTILMQKIKDLPTRFWYMQQTIANGWSCDVLANMIKSRLHIHQGNVANNFERALSLPQSELAKQMFKDPYIFDFMTLAEPFSERELEQGLVKHVEKFLLELGAGFAFVGRQFKLDISDKEFYIDLLFYHLKMRCFVVIELKRGDFLPEYAGKMN